jgi:type IV pilus assembly protein PilC
MAEAIKADMYVYEGTDKAGKKVTGEMSGQSDALVKAVLRRKGINPLKVKKKPKLSGGKGKITTKDITIFSRQMATMMSSGVPLVQSFEIVGRGHENRAMQELICISASCTSIWSAPARRRVFSRPSCTSSPRTWKKPNP